MPIYLLTPLADNQDQAAQLVIKHVAQANRYQLPNGSGWLIFYPGTSVELSNFLGITGFAEGMHPSLTSVLITSVGSYYGRAQTDMWEWLKTRFEGAP